MTTRFALSVLALSAGILPLPALAQTLPPPLSSEEAREARQIVEAMKVDERGPYSAIRWYCADGSTHP
ncbi:MAG: hypothetical protein ABIF09_08020, partial [Gemmatimonadota bacterium]